MQGFLIFLLIVVILVLLVVPHALVLKELAAAKAEIKKVVDHIEGKGNPTAAAQPPIPIARASSTADLAAALNDPSGTGQAPKT